MKRLLLIATSIFAVLPVAAQQAVPSLLVNTDPVALGHAGASVALDADAFVLDNNTASMSFYEGKMDAALSYSSWQPSAAKDKVIGAGAFSKLGDKFALGLTFELFKMPSYDIYNSDGVKQQVNGSFSPNEFTLGVGASYLLGRCFSAGLNLKVASSNLAPSAKASVFAADIYAAFKSEKGLSAGLGLCNLGSKATYSSSSYSLPAYLRAGAAYRVKGFTTDAELDCLFGGAFMAGVSAGWWFKQIAGLTVGYHYGSGKAESVYIPSYLSLGLGLKLAGFHLDGAYLLGSKELGGAFAVSLGYRF